MNSATQARPAAVDVAVTARRTRARFGILALLAIGTMINYLDRSVAGIAAPGMSHELGLNPALMGVIFSAFSWTYTASQIPGGVMLDRVGTRWTYFFALALWSLFTGLQGLAMGFVSLLIMRLLIGIAEAPRGRHLVPAERARPRNGHLHLRGIRRTGVPEPLAFLAGASVRMARAVRHRRYGRRAVRGRLADALS
jgi:MFS family permease